MRIEKRSDGRIAYRGEILRGDIAVVPSYYVEIGDMKAIVLDLYDGDPDENDDIYEMCRVMLEDGTFEHLTTWDLTSVRQP